MYLQDEALVLIRSDFKERASRYVLLTREHGKIEARMDGARNIHSKLSGHVEPVSLSEVYLIKGRSGYKMIQTELVKRFIFSQDSQLAFVWHFIETLNRFLPEEVPEKGVYDLVVEVLSYLESIRMITKNSSDRESFSLSHVSGGLWGYVYLNVLFHLGYFPGNFLVSGELRKKAEAFLSMRLSDGIVEMESHEEIISLVLNTVKEILQTENKSSGYLKETLRDSNIRMHTNATNKN